MNDCGISKLDLKRRNRMQILRVVREQGPISRVDISATLQITRAAVTIITNEMIDQHVLEEIGEEPILPGMEVRKGRRKILLDINETFRFALGVYVDEKEISIGMTTLNAAALDKRTIPHDGNLTVEDAISIIDTTVHTILHDSCLGMEHVLGIGIGIMPSMYAHMQGEKDENSMMVFPALQEALEERLETKIYVCSAIVQFAMAGIHYRESHAKAEDQVFVYLQEEQYCAIPLHGAMPMYATNMPADYIEKLSVDPNGRKLEGYARGSVHAELSKETMIEKICPLFSDAKTPALYALLEGDLSHLTLSTLLTAAESDALLRPVTDVLLTKFVMMLHHLYCMHFAEYISLYGFGFTEQNLGAIRSCAEKFADTNFANSILLTPIQERYHFLCGCTYMIQRGFYQRGGLI